MKRTIITIALVLLGAVSVLAQAKPDADKKPAGPMPTVDQVLDKYIKAVGGKEASMKVTSRVEKGMLEIAAMGVSAPVEIYTLSYTLSLHDAVPISLSKYICSGLPVEGVQTIM